MPNGIGNGGGPMGPTTDASNLGIPEPSAMPGGIGDIDSLLAQMRSGQIGAEQLLPLLFLLMAQATGGQPGAMPGAMGPAPPGPMGPMGPADSGSPIDAAMMDIGGGMPPAGPPGMGGPPMGGEGVPPELMALLGGGGF